MVISQTRSVDMRPVLSYSLSPVSLPLASSDGGLAKTHKAQLMAMLERVKHETRSRWNSCFCFDCGCMALIRSLFTQKTKPKTFQEMAVKDLKKLQALALHHNYTRVNFVCDRYHLITIKSGERQRRAGDGTLEIQTWSDYTSTVDEVPGQWKKQRRFLDNPLNAFQQMSLEGHGFLLFCISKEKCRSVQLSQGAPVVTNIPKLASTQQEADISFILHALDARNHFRNVLIWPSDTDVGVIGITYPRQFSDLNLIAERGQLQRVVKLTMIAQILGQPLAVALPAVHAFSGCNSTSYFIGKGKHRYTSW